MQYVVINQSRLPTTNVLVQNFIFQTNTTLITHGGLVDSVSTQNY